MMISMKWHKIFKDEASSSMDEARSLALNSAQEGTVVCVGWQLSGRGRQGRPWASPKGGLYCAILLKPDWRLQDISKMTLLAAVAVCEAVREFSGIEAQIKWPNDLLIDGKKLAGILTESEIQGKSVKHVIVGIGVNVNTSVVNLPNETVSLKELTGREHDVKNVLDEVLARFEFWYENVSQNGFEKMLNRWRELCGMLGRQVRAEIAQGMIEGVAKDIADDGGLLIKKDNGEIVKVTSGDVSQIRNN
jgi:BirA family biotin operon repressor/biotin-[acetyl-CoA-carboxylase] ligase